MNLSEFLIIFFFFIIFTNVYFNTIVLKLSFCPASGKKCFLGCPLPVNVFWGPRAPLGPHGLPMVLKCTVYYFSLLKRLFMHTVL